MATTTDYREVRSGRIQILTASGSTYDIDLDRQELVRIRNPHQPTDPESIESAALRRDGTPIKVLQIVRLEVGRRAEFILEPSGNPRKTNATWRSTTTVLAVEELASDPTDAT